MRTREQIIRDYNKCAFELGELQILLTQAKEAKKKFNETYKECLKLKKELNYVEDINEPGAIGRALLKGVGKI